jgi:hypothetical protein
LVWFIQGGKNGKGVKKNAHDVFIKYQKFSRIYFKNISRNLYPTQKIALFSMYFRGQFGEIGIAQKHVKYLKEVLWGLTVRIG